MSNIEHGRLPTAKTYGRIPAGRRSLVRCVVIRLRCSGSKWYFMASSKSSLHCESSRISDSLSTQDIKNSRPTNGKRTWLMSWVRGNVNWWGNNEKSTNSQFITFGLRFLDAFNAFNLSNLPRIRAAFVRTNRASASSARPWIPSPLSKYLIDCLISNRSPGMFGGAGKWETKYGVSH